MLERLNAQLARLHDHIAAAGRAGRVEARRWLAARDACRDVDCLDRLYETGIREARLALIDVETRTPAFVVSNARGDVLRVVEKAPPPAPLPFEVKSIQEAPARERSGVGLSTALALLAALITYAMVVKRLAV